MLFIQLVGLERDLEFFKDVDQLIGNLNSLITSTIGNENLCRIKIQEVKIETKSVLLVDVTHSLHKVFFKETAFYIRTDHGSQEVKPANVDSAWKSRNSLLK